jgi:phosphotransferase system HPr (HPr) family protein
LTDQATEAVGEVTVRIREGLHARPVMRLVDVATTYQSQITICNVTLRGEELDGKSAMQMMLLEATHGCVLRIAARGTDAREAVAALIALIESGFDAPPASDSG